jgi:hypothetical protein
MRRTSIVALVVLSLATAFSIAYASGSDPLGMDVRKCAILPVEGNLFSVECSRRAAFNLKNILPSGGERRSSEVTGSAAVRGD